LHHQRVIENPFHLLLETGRILEPGGPVDGEGVVNGRDHGDPQGFPEEHAVAETLVIMEDIEAVGFYQLPQLEEGSETEGFDLRKDTEARGGEFIEMKGSEDLEGLGGRQKILCFPEEVKIFNLVDDRSVEKQRERGADDDMYLVAQFYQFVGQVSQVNSLAAAIRVSPVTQQTDLHDDLPPKGIAYISKRQA
jgi:hypothetical protein